MPRYNNLRDDDYTGVAPPSGIATPGGAYTATATDSPAPTPNATAAPTDAAAAMPPAAAPQSETSEQSAPSFAARAAHWAKALIIGEAAAADELPTDVHGLISAALSHNVGPIYSGDGSDGEVPVLASQRRTKGTLGWFDGVWIPVVLNIWGVILFLRMGWLVGQAGILVGIVIITLANTITTLTTLSLSALCSSGEVKDGGAYYLISRALGPAYGGTIGVLLFLGQTVALAMYVIGFAESLYDYLQKLIGFDYLTVSDDVDVIVFGVVTMIAVLLISFVGIGFVQRMQTVLFGVLVVSFAAVAIGAFLPMLPNLTSNARRGFVGYWAILGDTAWADVPKDLIPKNRQPATVLSNMMPDFSTDPDTMISHDFFTVFSIIFPAVTGIMAGANLSGDLKNPGSAIPKGTLLGIVVAYIVYVGFVFIVGLTCIRCVGVGCPGVGQHADAAWARSVANTKFEPTGGLSYNKLIVADIAVWDGFVYLGCFAATLSSALASITGAPRILMRVARDGIFPCRACCKLFAKGYCVSDEPYVALALTFCIGTGCVLLGKIDLVAPIISNFFIMSYAITNYACFVVSRTRSTMFRPAFTWYNEWLSLFSAVLCIVVMVMMSVGMAIGSLVIGFVIFKLLQCIHQPHPGPGGEPKISWGGQVDNETTFVAALDAIAATQRVLPHARTFRPRFLVMSGSPCVLDTTCALDAIYVINV
jgi:amino acid transporter|tara:strand:- start:25 stop:2139 length:2115 start_codon:yes stop_codon:yes gene_type:complete